MGLALRKPIATAVLLVSLLMGACTPASPPASTAEPGAASAPRASEPGRRKVLNLGLRTVLDGFAISASATLQGGGLGYIEIHSQGLFSSDKTTGRPSPRLLTDQPTLENGGLQVTSDGKMVATYKLRKDVKWADGTPFNSHDLLFSHTLAQDRSIPIPDPTARDLMESATAPDEYTFAITWKQPYYMADALGPTLFWPLPAHLLEADYQSMVVEKKDIQAFITKPFWITEYVGVGPFKLVDFKQGDEAVFDAVDAYFLGRAKVDRIVVKQIIDPNTLFANILSGAIDLSTDNALPIENGVQLKQRWDAEQGGTVWYATGPTWFVAFQFEPSTPEFNPVILDRNVRQALYHAIDRDTLAEAVLAGIQGRAADALLSPDHPLHSFVKDGWKQRYPYDPQRAAAMLNADGWRPGPDGVLTHPTLGRLRIDNRTTQGNERKMSIVSDSWRKVGADVTELVMTGAAVRDREYRQAYPGVEVTARGNEDIVLTRVECAAIPTAANRYSGNNRGHWCNPELDRLASQYRAELREQARGPLIKQIQDILLDELPIGLLNYEVSVVLARKGVTAFADDFKGGGDSGRGFGTYSRNAHEWDIQ
jgi:peptide/nickel transport system substrate-binding protein